MINKSVFYHQKGEKCGKKRPFGFSVNSWDMDLTVFVIVFCSFH